MKSAIAIAVLVLCGCSSLTPTQKRAVEIGAAVLVTGAIIAHQQDHGGGSSIGRTTIPGNPCTNPEMCK